MLLKNKVHVAEGFTRSANVELDHGVEAVNNYIPTERALDVLRRFTAAIKDPKHVRAWTLTGPYGAGKSSFAVFLRGLAGPLGAVREASDARLEMADPDLAALLQASRSEEKDGFVLCTVTAQREPIRDTILRAIKEGLETKWGSSLPEDVAEFLPAAESGQDSRTLLRLLQAISEHYPALILIDEFGKNLEHAIGGEAGGDLFLLQDLAEHLGSRGNIDAYLFTLQHLAFDAYAAQAAPVQRREWAKVQGRFEDIPFLDSPAEASRCIAAALVHDTGAKWAKQMQKWAKEAYSEARAAGLSDVGEGKLDRIAGCYPLHPASLVALPELSARYGQNGRTLFTFLASQEPLSIRAFLETHNEDGLPTVKLAHIYDYFVESASTILTASGEASRWLEIDARIREAHGLTDEDLQLLKTIGVLNLISQGGNLRASAGMVGFAASEIGSTVVRERVAERLKALESSGLLVYRAFSDEYRIWQGTDFDIDAALAKVRDELRGTPLVDLLNQVESRRPIVAARHSQQVGMLRYFSTFYADPRTSAAPDRDEGSDGYVALVIGDQLKQELLDELREIPIVAAYAPEAQHLEVAAAEVLAIRSILSTPGAIPDRDWVARRELQERESAARTVLEQELRSTFNPRTANLNWKLELKGKSIQLDAARPSRSAFVSAGADLAYPDSPQVNSEMAGRDQMSSQGARARRSLIQAMIENPGKEHLGIDGFGPERSLYESLLRSTGLHTEESGEWGLRRKLPKGELRNLTPMWSALHGLLDKAEDPITIKDILRALAQPPYGVKLGAGYVYVIAALLVREEDIAVFQDGVYQTQFSIELAERMLKMPERFSVRRIRPSGDQLGALEAISSAFNKSGRTGGMSRRNASLIFTASLLLQRVRDLNDYSTHTRSVSKVAQDVRMALLTAEDPVSLLFETLPLACGHEVNPTGTEAADFALTLVEVLKELAASYGELLTRVGNSTASLRGCKEVSEFRSLYSPSAKNLAGRSSDPKLRAFLHTVGNTELDNESWVENMALACAGKPMSTWRDHDAEQFEFTVRTLVSLWQRMEAVDPAVVGPDAYRLSVTRSDGSEDLSVQVITPEELEAAASWLKAAQTTQLKSKFPALPALAMVLAQELAVRAISSEDGVTDSERKRSN